MSKPIPSVKQMLLVAEGCGLNTVEEAYFDYIRHYDLFFYIPELKVQEEAFIRELETCDFLESLDGQLMIKDITIEQAMNKLKLEAIGINSDFLDPEIPNYDESFIDKEETMLEIASEFDAVLGQYERGCQPTHVHIDDFPYIGETHD